MTTTDQQSLLYLSLGMVAGTLSNPDVMRALVQGLQSQEVHAEYVRAVRDRLTDALDEAAAP